MRYSFVFAAASFAPEALAKLSCPDLSSFDITCRSDASEGVAIRQKEGAPELIQSGDSSLKALLTSANGCNSLMERKYIDEDDQERSYTVSCYFAEGGVDYNKKKDRRRRNYHLDESRLVCTNFGFAGATPIQMEVQWGYGSDDNEEDEDVDEEVHILGTSSTKKSIFSWSDTCTFNV